MEERENILASPSNTPTLIDALGIQIGVLGPERTTGKMASDSRTVQPAGIMHAGALASLADTLASLGTLHGLDPATQYCVGQELNISLLRPVPMGASVEGEALIVHRGRTTAVWDVRIYSAGRKLVAIGRCTIAIRPLERAR